MEENNKDQKKEEKTNKKAKTRGDPIVKLY
jgi:hypothetical protein